MTEQDAAPPRKEKKKKKKGKSSDEDGEFPFTLKQMIIAGVVIVLLLLMRAGYDDGSSKSKDDDLLDGQDLYEVMEIPKSATDREVKKAYHKLAMKWHPDKNAGCEDCMLKFQRVARAYEVLSDPMKRKIYDNEQKMMEKSIKSDSVMITSANYKELVVPGSLWFIQVYVDWSDRCQWFAPMWEEVHNQLQGTINMGRINLGRDKGLGARLQGSKDVLPSVAMWDGELEVRRVRWAFHDISVEGIIKLIAQAAAERYKALMMTEVRELKAWLAKTDKVRVLFVGKAGSKEQIAFTVAAGGISPSLELAITSKLSVGKAAYSQVKPPAVIIFRGEGEGEIPLVVSGKLKRSEMAALLEANKRVLCPRVHRDNYRLACGGHAWCALLVVSTLASSSEETSLVAAGEEVDKSLGVRVQVGTIAAAGQSEALRLLGAGDVGDMLLIRRLDEEDDEEGAGMGDAGGGGESRMIEVWLVPPPPRARDFVAQIAAAVERRLPPRRAGMLEEELLRALAVYRAPLLTRVLAHIEDLSVEQQIVLYVVGIVVGFLLLCPCFQPLLAAASMRLDRDYIDSSYSDRGRAPQHEGEEDRGDEYNEEDEEDEEEDAVVVKKRQ